MDALVNIVVLLQLCSLHFPNILEVCNRCYCSQEGDWTVSANYPTVW